MDQPLNTLPAKRSKHTFLWKVAVIIVLAIFSVVFSLYQYVVSHSRAMLVIALSTTLVTTAVIAWVLFGSRDTIRRHPVRFFGITLFSVCVLFSSALAPFSVPDESRHYLATYWTSDVLLGQTSFAGGEAFPIRTEDLAYYDLFSGKITNADYISAVENFQLFANSSETTLYDDKTFTVAKDPIQSHFGAVVGLTVGRLLNLGAAPTYYLGRIGAAAFFVFIVMWALKVMPFGQRIIMAVCLLPITISLAASYSYDSCIIAMSMLSIAYLLRAIYGEGLLTRWDIIPICVLACLLSPCKAVYAVLFGAVLLVPAKRFKNKGMAWLFRCGVIGLAATSTLLANISSLIKVSQSNSSVGVRGDVESDTGIMYSFPALLQDPMGAAVLFVRSFAVQGPSIILQTLGWSLGPLQAELTSPAVLCGVFAAFLGLSAVRTPDDSPHIPMCHAAFYVMLALIGSLGVWLSLCVGWTFIGEATIQGVQGRYFIPFIPLIVLACRCGHVTWSKTGSAITVVSAMAYLNVFYVISVMAAGLTL